MVGQGHRRLPTPPHPVLHHRAADQALVAAIADLDDAAWTDIDDDPDCGIAQVAETTLAGAIGGARLLVRRTRLVGPQATLWPDWRYHALVTDRPGSTIDLDADHRRQAVCELAIRDLKHGAGLRHCPSGVFLANAAWALTATLAHNLLRWTATLGCNLGKLVAAKTLRRRYLHLPGRTTRSARRTTLHLPAAWPWAAGLLAAAGRLWDLNPRGDAARRSVACQRAGAARATAGSAA